MAVTFTSRLDFIRSFQSRAVEAKAEVCRDPLEIVVSDLGQWRSELDSSLTDLQTAMQDLYSALARERNTTIPVGSLPTELLAEIFSYGDIRSMVQIIRVCHNWRKVALDHPVLWSHGEISRKNPELSRLIIRRSAETPLDLHFRSTGKHNLFDLSGLDELSTLDRIRSICYVSNQLFETEPPYLPNLKSLHLDKESIKPLSFVRYAWLYPNLRHLSIESVDDGLVNNADVPKQLETLHLYDVEEPLVALELALKFPNLKELSIQGGSVAMGSTLRRTVKGYGSKTLKLIRLLKIRKEHVTQFLDRMVHPETHVLLGSLGDPTWIPDIVTPLVGTGRVWIRLTRKSHSSIIYERPSSLIRLRLTASIIIIIPALIALHTIHTLCITHLDSSLAVDFQRLVGLKRLVLEFSPPETVKEPLIVGTILGADPLFACPQLGELTIAISLKRRDAGTTFTLSESSNFSSITTSETPSDDTTSSTGSYDESNDDEEGSSQDTSGEHGSSNSEESSSLSEQSSGGDGEPIHIVNSTSITQTISKFLDKWLVVHGVQFGSLIVRDEFDAQRWIDLAPILSTKVSRLDLGSSIVIPVPPSLPEVRSFGPRCKECQQYGVGKFD